jgi:hypothetical protein
MLSSCQAVLLECAVDLSLLLELLERVGGPAGCVGHVGDICMMPDMYVQGRQDQDQERVRKNKVVEGKSR